LKYSPTKSFFFVIFPEITELEGDTGGNRRERRRNRVKEKRWRNRE
jgi:hypothetical protein